MDINVLRANEKSFLLVAFFLFSELFRFLINSMQVKSLCVSFCSSTLARVYLEREAPRTIIGRALAIFGFRETNATGHEMETR